MTPEPIAKYPTIEFSGLIEDNGLLYLTGYSEQNEHQVVLVEIEISIN